MNLKDAKKQCLIDEATRLFLTQSIAGVTIRDIARAGGVGEATVYRTFGGRNELVLACAIQLQRQVGARFLTEGPQGLSGYERLARFYAVFVDILAEHPELYRFLSEFDAFCLREGIRDLDEYADNMDAFREAFIAAYEDGVRDKSVRPLPDRNTFYYATTHATLSLCKKLAVEGGLLRQDRQNNKLAEARAFLDVVLAYLKP